MEDTKINRKIGERKDGRDIEKQKTKRLEDGR